MINELGGKMKRLTSILLVAFVVLGLSACGGSSSGEVTATQVKSGIYSGSWTASDGSSGVLAAQVSGNKLYAVSNDLKYLQLELSLNGIVVTTKGRFYSDSGSATVDGAITGSGTLKGDTVTMTLTLFDGQESQVVLTRSDISDDASSFDIMQGDYKSLDQIVDINLSAVGAVSGSDTDGCKYSGDISIIDAKINVYALTLTIADCPAIAGVYTGFISRYKKDGSIISGIFGNESALAGIILK
ncbi:hypothetical protein HWV01_17675 [Moritella sp. 5]|uniref:hypothetical protein n=1 Tax=Moritella sp. 5 TaxID=2746231 RepID=UPI001BA87469|nr:hypothetical protein [Moritella sp. 5]QUM81978.1 hypothetical protein HWV01_17675 [Moritella sp. 5]